uniref:sperm-associated antigen 17-like n=1 Tax=Myxine glutinosa TaxID=7769 RepID=UPI00358FDF56
MEDQTIFGFSDVGLDLMHGKDCNTTEVCTSRVIATRGQETLSLQPLEVIRTAEPVEVCENSSSGQQETVVVKREDGTVIVLGENCVVDHNDGTRITTSAKDMYGVAATSGPWPKVSKQVMVEKIGFATLLFDCEDRVCTALMGSGTLLRARPEGSYQVFPAKSPGSLTVHADGTATYLHSGRLSAQAGEHTDHLHGIYTLRPKAHVACEAIDSDGNIFQRSLVLP